MAKIDVYAHICPKKFLDAFSKRVADWEKIVSQVMETHQQFAIPPLWADLGATLPMLWDIDNRLKIMDRHEDYVQILVPMAPPVHTFCSTKDAAYLASIFNDGLA